MQAYFSRLIGVKHTYVGYTNGNTKETDYKLIKQTNHAECIYIEFDDTMISLAEILTRFINLIDPYSINKQGEDEGTQYRSGIYYKDEHTKNVALSVIESFERIHQNKKVAIEVKTLTNFVKAEEYHQDYLNKNPDGYCHIDISYLYNPISKVNKKSIKEIKEMNLSLDEYEVLFNYNNLKTNVKEIINERNKGLYIDKISKQALFLSSDRFFEENNKLYFTKAITTDALIFQEKHLKNKKVTEVFSSIQGCFIGLFETYEQDRNIMLFEVNSLSVEFIPYNQLENTIYDQFIPFFV
ncbi:UNVERIFIED_CONTAM: peptide-methionine (S)-S-oxide reductase MsrA [Campylobacter lari]